jgi:hypothetical protein
MSVNVRPTDKQGGGMSTHTPNAPDDTNIIEICSAAGPLVTIKPNGAIEYGEGYTPDGAATIFWQAIAQAFPALRSSEGRAGVIERVSDEEIWNIYYKAYSVEHEKHYLGNQEYAEDADAKASLAGARACYQATNRPSWKMAEMPRPEKLPPCMIPDGGDCCPQYDKLRREVEELRAELKIQDDANEILTRRLSDARTVRVPREPTMGQWDDFCAVHHVPFDKFIVAYKAMLAAAPSGGRNE